MNSQDHVEIGAQQVGNPRPTPASWRSILNEAVRRGWPVSEVVRRTGASIATVRKYCRLHVVALPPGDPAPRRIDWAAEFEHARAHGETIAQLAARIKVTSSAIDKAKVRFGVQLSRGKGGGPVCPDWRMALESARSAKETQSDVARRLGVPRQTVNRAAARLGIALRDGRKAPVHSNVRDRI